ncbi:MAG: hypothetical protein ABEJ67_00430 [Halanaeroarchaeum sp.]
MKRREYLATIGSAGFAGLAGCSGMLESRSPYAPPVVEDRPEAVYYPSHVEGMATIGVTQVGPYGCALTYTYPHRFWLVMGSRTERVSIRPADSIHLMPVVWDRETGIVLPDAAPSVSIVGAEESITSVNPWAMLSQPMGLHFGDNVHLPDTGSYEVTVGIAAPTLPRLGGMAAGPAEQRTCRFEFEYSRSERDDIQLRRFPEKKGTRGAVEPMRIASKRPSQAPAPEALPGRLLGSATSGDAAFAAVAIEDASAYGGTADQTYLAVSPRTPYNRHVLPMMGLSATVERNGATVVEEPLTAAIAPALSVHYGTVLEDLRPGDALTITVETPPQLARHEGYETAFFDMPPMTLSA